MNKIIEIKFGSHLYGTNTKNSDLDIKGIYLPEAKDILLNKIKSTIQSTRSKKHGERNTKNDIDCEYLSLCRFLELLAQGQTMALDMLFSPEFKETENVILLEIYNNRHRILNKNVNAFVGYAKKQAAKYGIKGSRMEALQQICNLFNELVDSGHRHSKLYEIRNKIEILINNNKNLVSLEKTPLIEIIMLPDPDKILNQPHLHVCGRKVHLSKNIQEAYKIFKNILNEYGHRSKMAHLEDGIDWKALSHAVRVNNEAIELLKTGNITMPRPDALLLKKIKTGKLKYEKVSKLIETGLVDLMKAKEESTLNEVPDQDFIDNLLVNVYKDIIKGS